MKYEQETTKSKVQLDELYNSSALTFEGLIADEDNLNAVCEWLKQYNALIDGKDPKFFITSGEMMNKSYGLKGSNRYPDDLTVVSLDSNTINQLKVTLPRFSVGARWFDDIVDNNARRNSE